MSTACKIGEDDRGKRLDIFLTEKFPEESRSQWQKKIKSGAVLVNGAAPSVHQFLKVNDKVAINFQPSAVSRQPSALKYKLIFETKDYLIVEKPAGLLTHRVNGELGLADQIIKDYPEIKNLPAEFSGATAPQRNGGIGANREAGVGEADRAGIVHRLDRDASGLLVVARTPEFFQHIKKQFADRNVKKIYLALAYGEIQKDEDDLNFVIARGSEGRMAARPVRGIKTIASNGARPSNEPYFAKATQGKEGKEAKTHIKVLERFKNYTYLEAQIFTGRTHQIRAHLLAYGHGIVGDRMYKPRSASRRKKIKNPFFAGAKNALRSLGEERAGKKVKDFDVTMNGKPESRLFLHSHILGFEDRDGKHVEYKSGLPKELKECLEKLK